MMKNWGQKSIDPKSNLQGIGIGDFYKTIVLPIKFIAL